MKFLIVGLGNIGAEYDNTRHNIGFHIIDQLAEQFDAKWQNASHGVLATFKHRGKVHLLLKPDTYVNRSGRAVSHYLKKERIPIQNLLIVLDDLNLDFGKQRLRLKGSSGGHNGLKDIQTTLGHSNYPRLRIGIGADYNKGQQVDFVLGTWNSDELILLPQITESAIKSALDHFKSQAYRNKKN